MTIFNVFATLQTDDGRLTERVHASISVVDYGQRFEDANVGVAFDEPFSMGFQGTLATDFHPTLPSDTVSIFFGLQLMLKGDTCIPGCAPGQTVEKLDPTSVPECIMPSGLLTADVSYGGDLCGSSAYVASWSWD